MSEQLILTEENDNVVPFIAPTTGGKDGDENWLAALEVGTCFLSRSKQSLYIPGTKYLDPELVEHHVIFKTDTTTLLMASLPGGQSFRRHVDTLRFSRAHECVKVLGVARQEEKEEVNNGDSSDVQS